MRTEKPSAMLLVENIEKIPAKKQTSSGVTKPITIYDLKKTELSFQNMCRLVSKLESINHPYLFQITRIITKSKGIICTEDASSKFTKKRNLQ